jgi:hypothetical protein
MLAGIDLWMSEDRMAMRGWVMRSPDALNREHAVSMEALEVRPGRKEAIGWLVCVDAIMLEFCSKKTLSH